MLSLFLHRLLELYRPRRFARQVIEYAVHAADFFDDAGHDRIENFVRNPRGIGRHEVGRGDRTDDAGIIIRSFIAHAADGAHVGEGCEVLVRISVETGLCHLLAEDRIGILYETNLLGSDFTNDTDRKTRTRERLTENKVLRYT